MFSGFTVPGTTGVEVLLLSEPPRVIEDKQGKPMTHIIDEMISSVPHAAREKHQITSNIQRLYQASASGHYKESSGLSKDIEGQRILLSFLA